MFASLSMIAHSVRNTLLITSVAIYTLGIAYWYWSVRRLRDRKGNPIPNGPVGLPIVGCFPFLTHYPEHVVDKWAKEYGPLYSLWLGNQLFIVVSDPIIAKDLFILNGSPFLPEKKCSSSPRLYSALEESRIHHTVICEATVLVQELYRYGKAGEFPINPQPHIGRNSLNNMLMLAFWIRTEGTENPLVKMALRLSREFMNCTGPTSNLTDFLPLLQRIPNPSTARAKRLRQAMIETYGGLVKDVEARMQKGDDIPDCVAKYCLLNQEKEQLSDFDVLTLCAAFMIGGVETATIIPAYPEIQAKAHEELDRVVGHDRLPTVEDEKDLPYIHAIIKEVERCYNPFWLGTPHMNTQELTYRGQYIPRNTVMVLNCYTLHHDPVRYPDPFAFKPERYINDSYSSYESANLGNPMERDHWTFGIGRRICTGMLFAEREIWLGISHMLWAFRMEQTPGEPINLKDYDGFSGRSPVTFHVRMIPRHEKVVEVQ
ncbi:hypothetical protein AMATHDRAFT_50287 [Amanita thiersii Skay4041]|uniref:Cytochrome P450 n=1 Tax=Amanita thiersii Skay4041 TaxID=703135 RepID=A0A2A9NID5_9AGAR|nr:hypothetical protein AMATHDRAFT_50287 [Amanita thiersii Skay4041]